MRVFKNTAGARVWVAREGVLSAVENTDSVAALMDSDGTETEGWESNVMIVWLKGHRNPQALCCRYSEWQSFMYDGPDVGKSRIGDAV